MQRNKKPFSKTIKNRLTELANFGNNTLNEEVDDNTKVEVTLTTTIGKIKEMIEPDWLLNIDDQSALQAFQREMQEDLNQWFHNNGGEWMSDGINQDGYADYITYGEDPID
tara:strand:+ start:365 stop:697 length:333 start_codon:yes stop_codon:yes gene_type:complete